MLVLLLPAAAAWAATGVSPQPLDPGEGNTYDLYVGVEEEHDDNLFRLPNGQAIVSNSAPPAGEGIISTSAPPNASRSDRISTASIGADGQWVTGRQVVDVDLHLDENRFANNDFLNNTSGLAKLLWTWQVGPYFSGTAGADYSHSLVSFGETLFLGRDLINVQNYFGTVRYQLGPHWALYGGVNDTSVAHTAPLAEVQDFKTEAGHGGIEYALDEASVFSFEYRFDRGVFNQDVPDIFNGVDIDPDFHDSTLLLKGTHTFSDKTQVVAEAGYVKRDYPNTFIGSYSGYTGRLTVEYQPTDKTNVEFAAWHELHAYLVSQLNYFVGQGASVAPSWSPTDRITVKLLASYEHQHYIPASDVIVGPIDAHVQTESLNVNYQASAHWLLSLSYAHASRSSDDLLFRYRDNLAAASVIYIIH